MSKRSNRILADDVIAGLDGVLEHAERCRDALLAPYQKWSSDNYQDEGEDGVTGAPKFVTRVRTLGPPFDLGAREGPDVLTGLAPRLARAGARTRELGRVERADARLSHLVRTYGKGLYAGMRPSAWRAEVKKLHDDVLDCVAAAKQEIEDWEKEATAEAGPDSSVLKDQELVFPETLVKMFGGTIKRDAALKMITSGRLGTVLKLSDRHAVSKTDMFAAMARNAAAGKRKRAEKPPSRNPVANLRPRRGARAPGAEAPPPIAASRSAGDSEVSPPRPLPTPPIPPAPPIKGKRRR